MPSSIVTFRSLCLGLLAAAPLVAFAQGGHTPLVRSETLGFDAVLDAALQQAPERVEASVRREQADAFVSAGRSFLAGRPSVALNFYDDGLLSDRGQVEANYGVQVPLWRPGERGDSRDFGARYQAQVAVWEEALRLDLAGRVRSVLADIHEAEVLLALEREATTTAEDVLRVSETLFEAGALARVDVLQSRNLLLDQQKRQYSAEAMLVDSEIAYEFLTGLDELPAAQHVEAQNAATEITAEHPLLRYLQSEVDVRDGAVRQSEIAAKGNPVLLFGTRHERGDRFTPYTDSVNLQVTIPFGAKGFVDSRTSGARRDKADAEVQYRATLRELELALHDAEHELFIVRQALPLAREQAALGAERQELAQGAFAQGELTLAQVLLAVQEARIATRELAVLEASEQRLITEYNQLTGVLP